MLYHESLLLPLAIVLLEPQADDDIVGHLKKRLRLPKRLAQPLAKYYTSIRHSMMDEELLLHRLTHRPRGLMSRHAWDRDYAPVRDELIERLSELESKGKLGAIQSPPARMVPTWEKWPVPSITTLPALAEFLSVTLHQLEGLADIHGLQRHIPPGPRHHYRYRWVKMKRGKCRLLEIPKRRLKTVHRRILDGILSAVPPHDAAHGFRSGRSIVTNATQHLQQEVVIRFDLADFFTSIKFEKVMATFRRMGYPRLVARYLAAICTKATPDEVWRQHPAYESQPSQWQQMGIWRHRHLPQGAPTSPALANLAAYHLDSRCWFLALQNHWHYTRYADDLTFSGSKNLAHNSRQALMTLLATIVQDEGYRINLKKTRLMRKSQRQEVCGIVVNQKCNVRRVEYDQLNAILHNCVKHGAASQNRDGVLDFVAHLRGRIAAVGQVNAARGEKLLRLWKAVAW